MRRLRATLRAVAESILAAAIGLVVAGFILKAWGYSPISAYIALFEASFRDLYGIAGALANATPLILTALTFAVAARAGLFNIGAEGQMYFGALAAVAASLFRLPPGLHLLVALAFAGAAGVLWSLVPSVLRATRGVSEVISTIMFNWIGRYLAFWLVANVLVDPYRAEKTITVLPGSRFPTLVPGTDLSYAIFLAVAVALLVYFLLWHTVTGYEMRAAGANPDAARYGGVRSAGVIVLVFLLGGITAGLAGATQSLGRPPTYAVYSGLPQISNLGFDGIGVAMIGRNHPLGIIFAAVFYGGLQSGARVMQLFAGIPLEMVRVVQGVIVLALALPELLRIFRILRRRRVELGGER
ncbi:TPA: ABC transporter permease [Candidatus Bipolaricaulota bacterium]|nr:ABC transporter permease [Candidatus Bipolaricaulota bacterium]HIP99835.1 ABC transporter permease [Candidatus Bipolaricaulota bacterium]